MALLDIEKAPKIFFQKCSQGGGGVFPSYHNELHVFDDQMFLKTWKFSDRKGTFDVNLVFTAIFASKKGTFHHKKGTFGPLNTPVS